MSGPLSIFHCTSCGASFFPEPLLCAHCHGAGFEPRQVESAVVEEVSVIHHMAGQADWVPRRIANVRVPDGPELTVGLHGEVAASEIIYLSLEGTAPFGRRP